MALLMLDEMIIPPYVTFVYISRNLKHITEYDFRTSAVPTVIPRIRIVSLSKTSYEEYCRNLTIKYYGPPNWMEDEPMVQKLNPELDRALPFFYR